MRRRRGGEAEVPPLMKWISQELKFSIFEEEGGGWGVVEPPFQQY
jgi:hypothetical protein